MTYALGTERPLMLAFTLTLAIIALFSVVGAATQALILRRLGLAEVLLSPAMGVAVLVVVLLTLGKLGVPVAVAACPLVAVGLGAFSYAALRVTQGRIRIEIPRREAVLVPCFLALAVAALAWPMLRFGFDWLSFTNEDMLNYTNSATYFLHHGYFTPPNAADYVNTRGTDNLLWAFDLYGGERVGVDYLLAFAMALTRLPETMPFMSFIVALYAVTVSAASAMVLVTSGSKRATLIAAALLTCSPLLAFGIVCQFLGQAGGLGLLCAAVCFMHRILVSREAQPPVIALAALSIGALGLAYPELAPFLIVTAFLQMILNRSSDRAGLKTIAASALIIAACSCLVWNVQMLQMAYLFHGRFSQVAEGLAFQNLSLLPRSIPAIFGLLPLESSVPDPWMSLAIFCGILLALLTVYGAVRQAMKGNTASCMLLAMSLVMASFYAHHSGYAMLKLELYVQPFLCATVAIIVADTLVVPVAIGLIGALLAVNIATQQDYVAKSMTTEAKASAYAQVRNASALHLVSMLKKHSYAKEEVLLTDTENDSLGSLIGAYAGNSELVNPSSDLPTHSDVRRYIPLYAVIPQPARNAGIAMNLARTERFRRESYAFQSGHEKMRNNFRLDTRYADNPTALHEVAASGAPITCLNIDGDGPHEALSIVPLQDVHNRLVYVRSTLGGSATSAEDVLNGHMIGLYQYESEYFGSGIIAAMGQHLLFSVLQPSPKVRLILSMTDTLRPDRVVLPQPSVIGASGNASIPVYGRGSARIISPAIQPMMIEGQAFIAIDMNREAYQNPEKPRTGFMRLFGSDIPLDPRKFVVYTRGISAISDEEYRALKPPSVVAKFPDDLLNNRALEYSGLYESGWASEDFVVRLSSAPGKPVVVDGTIPMIDDPAFTTEATVFVDGHEALRQTLGLGDFRLSMIAHDTTTRVRVRFSRTQKLPHGDNSVVGALLHNIGTPPKEKAKT